MRTQEDLKGRLEQLNIELSPLFIVLARQSELSSAKDVELNILDGIFKDRNAVRGQFDNFRDKFSRIFDGSNLDVFKIAGWRSQSGAKEAFVIPHIVNISGNGVYAVGVAMGLASLAEAESIRKTIAIRLS